MFLADSYAIIEYLKGNNKYKKYFEKEEIVTTKLNLMEVYYSTLSESNEEYAEKCYNLFLPKCVEINDNILKKELKFRHTNKKKKLSYVDAVCYQLSLEMKIKFLTGDKQFEGLKNVEFVK